METILKKYLTFLCAYLMLVSGTAMAEKIRVELDIPDINTSPYFRPYVAVWLETAERIPVTTLAIWYQTESLASAQEDGRKWLKDLRQWWRKIGRSQQIDYDAVTAATRKPGQYSMEWDSSSLTGADMNGGEYIIHFEAAREEGGRSYRRIPFQFLGRSQTITLPADKELGTITLHLGK